MTPTEMDLLHLRLQQIGVVLGFILTRVDIGPVPSSVLKDIAEVKKGLNR